jgi:kinesin family protein 6/9
MGDTANYEHRGIAPRAIAQLFNEINSRVEFEYRVSCTYMEIYNERIFDLLGDLSNPDQAPDYTIAEEKECRGTFVRGLTEVVVGSEKDALNLLFGGELSRTTATHRLNRRSNRSHSLFTMYVQQRQRSGVSEKIVHSKLHLIDLAGSERLKKTMESADGRTVTDEVTRKESMYINQSLTFLEQCVVALSRKGQTHIPYRQSKLTNILKDCLGANCNTLMIACMWGEAAHLEETVSTLRLASRMMRVQNETSTVETIDADALIKKQERLIKALKQDLLMHDALVERTGVTYDPYTPEQQASVVQMIERYIDASET